VLQCVAVCGSVSLCGSALQYVAVFRDVSLASLRLFVCCSVLQCVAVCCSVMQGDVGCCRVMQGVAVWCSMVHYGTVWCNVVQSVAV